MIESLHKNIHEITSQLIITLSDGIEANSPTPYGASPWGIMQ